MERERTGRNCKQTPHQPPVSVCLREHVSVYVQIGSREEKRRIKKQSGRVRIALGIPGRRGKALLFFPRKGACLSHQWTVQGCLAYLQKWPICDSDIVSVPVHPCGTIKGTMKCPEGQFPCPKESDNYLRSNLSFHPFPLCSFIGRDVSVCSTCAFVTSCVSVWVFVSMCIFM